MHRLRNFKNFDSADVDLFAPLTILLGRNASGKSNLIEGVELMAALARGVPFTDITDTGRGGALEVRGGLPSCPRVGSSGFGLRLDGASVPFERKRTPITYDIQLQVGRSGVHLHAERLTLGDRSLIDAKRSGPGLIEVVYDNFSPGPNPRRQVSAATSVLSRYEEVIAESRASTNKLNRARGTVATVRRFLQRAYVFDPIPKSMRDYERANQHSQLARDGSNLSAVLFELSRGTPEQESALTRVAETTRQIPEEPFVTIGFAETPLGDVMAGFETERGSNSKANGLVEARLLSDGTLRMLAILTALETVPEQSRIVIEEFDNGLHPSRATVLIRYLNEAATRRKLNIVLTTHNPAFMDALDDEQLRHVWICHRDDTKGASRVTRFADLDTAVTLGVGGGLGGFVSRGALEKRLAPDYRQKKAEAIQRWIASVS